MRKQWTRSTVVLLCALIAACSTSDEADQIASVRVINASPDSPVLEFTIGNLAFRAPFQVGTSFSSDFPGQQTLSIETTVQDSTMVLLPPLAITIEPNHVYSIIAVNNVANLDVLINEIDVLPPAANMFRIGFTHASNMTPTVEVYITDPAANLINETPDGTIGFSGRIPPFLIPADNYRIRFVEPSTSTVIYDTGEVDVSNTLTANFGLIIIDNVNGFSLSGPASPSRIIVVDGISSGLLIDQNEAAGLRVWNVGTQIATPIDLILNQDFANPFASNVMFGEITPYTAANFGTTNVEVTPTGDPNTILIQDDFIYAQAVSQTQYVFTDLVQAANLGLMFDDPRAVATEARFRILRVDQFSGQGVLDIYVVGVGEPITDPDLQPTFSSVSIDFVTNIAALLDGAHDVVFALAGTQDEIARQTATFMTGKLATWAVTDIDDANGQITFIEQLDP